VIQDEKGRKVKEDVEKAKKPSMRLSLIRSSSREPAQRVTPRVIGE
jgi:hypothetical protein